MAELTCAKCRCVIDERVDTRVLLPCSCAYHFLCYEMATQRRAPCPRHQQAMPFGEGNEDFHARKFYEMLLGTYRAVDYSASTTFWNDCVEMTLANPIQFNDATAFSRQVRNKFAEMSAPFTWQQRTVAWDAAVIDQQHMRFQQNLLALMQQSRRDPMRLIKSSPKKLLTPLDFSTENISANDFIDCSFTLIDLQLFHYSWHDFVNLGPTVENIKDFGIDNVLDMWLNTSVTSNHDRLWQREFYKRLCGGSLRFFLRLELNYRQLMRLKIHAPQLENLTGFSVRWNLPLFRDVTMKQWFENLHLDREMLLRSNLTQHTLRDKFKWTIDEAHSVSFHDLFNVTAEDFVVRDNLDD